MYRLWSLPLSRCCQGNLPDGLTVALPMLPGHSSYQLGPASAASLCVHNTFLEAAFSAAQAGLENEEQRVGAEIVRRALPYSLKLIARNAGSNGSVVVQKVQL